MDGNDNRRIFLASLPALTRPPPNINTFWRSLILILILVMKPPPDPLTDHRFFLHNGIYVWNPRNIFDLFSKNRIGFHQMTGETPETLTELSNQLSEIDSFKRNKSHLSSRNRVLLFLIWLQCYPTYYVLSTLFNVSVSTIKDELHHLIQPFFTLLSTYIKWPNVDEWQTMTNNWPQIPFAVGSLDGTSVEINKPKTEPQGIYFSGHRRYHAIHAQIIIDNCGSIRLMECGFPGHLNDAQQYAHLPPIGGVDLPFPDECVLLADKIYPNRHPIMTPYTSQHIQRQNVRDMNKYRKLNRLISEYRCTVERTICKVKAYRVLSGVWRQRRSRLRRVFHIVGGLVSRKNGN